MGRSKQTARRVALASALLAVGCSTGASGSNDIFGSAPSFGDESADGAISTGMDTGEGDGLGTWGASKDPEASSSGADQTDGALDEGGESGGSTGEPEEPADPLAPRLEYRFDEGAGGVVGNSGELDNYDLAIANQGAVAWQGSALRVTSPTIISGPGPAVALVQAITASDAFTVEAWVEPGALNQEGPARIVTLSSGSDVRNFTLGQGVVPEGPIDFLARVRTPATNSNGMLEGPVDPIHAGPGVITTQLTHLVLTRGPGGMTRLWVDGDIEANASLPGALDGWSANFALHLAGEENKVRSWLGTYHYVAVYDRAFSGAEVQAGFNAGPD